MKALAVVLVLFCAMVITASFSSETYASQSSLWTQGVPVIAKNKVYSARFTNRCPTYLQDMLVTELGAPRSVCVYGDERLKIGTFNEDGRDRTVVGFPQTNTMHILEGICSSICRYNVDTDVLVSQQMVSQYGSGLIVFKHASARIQRVISPPATVVYSFDSSHPDYEIKNDVGRYVWTPTFEISSNGKWIVVELYEHGTATLNLDTLDVRQIATDGYQYGRGMDPSEELAISNDGKSVVVTGQNTGFHVFDVSDGCGQKLVGDLTSLHILPQCSSSDLGVGVSFPNFAAAYHPKFYGNGHQLEVIVNSWVSGVSRVTFTTSGTPLAHQLKILTLGDSFSSGEGESDDTRYEPGTNQLFDRCHVSTRAYPALVAKKLSISDIDAKNLACSGAKISDIIGPSDDYWGQDDRLGGTGLRLSEATKMNAQEKALDNFQPGRTHQADFIERYSPEILIIGIGGNDAGLMGKLRTCAMPGTCEWAEGIGIKQTAGEIKGLFDKLGSLFLRIADQVSETRVFIVGYPDIIEPDGLCDPATAFLINRDERLFMQNSMHYLNQVIHAAANKAGFTYVDVEHSFDGTKLCSGASTSSMNSIRIGDDIAVLNILPMLKIIGAESFHPTPSGHVLMANSIQKNYPDMASTAIDTNNIDIKPPYYWNTENTATVRPSFGVNFAFKDEAHTTQMIITVPNGTLQPHSIATIEVHSDQTRLARFAVNEKGGIQGTIILPTALQEGFHTLHMLSVNRVGDDIDMYQFLTIGASEGVVGLGAQAGESGNTAGSDVVSNNFGSQAIGSGRFSGGSVGQSDILSDAIAVLGAQTISDAESKVQSVVQKIMTPIVSYVERAGWPLCWIAFAVIVVVATSLSMLCIILFSKRWAKPSS